MYPTITQHCKKLVQQFDAIPSERKEILAKISTYIQSKIAQKEPIQLMYVCTHNSRRSHFGQIWAAVAANYYSIPNLSTFSGGTEATTLHPNAIQALQTTGFDISTAEETTNPHYSVRFGDGDEAQTTCFSKVYDATSNPTTNFAAIMNCSDAETNCPFIPGVELRISTTYDDPKAFDHTPEQAAKYLERSNQIAVECLYVFSLIQL
jgi:protein-tyrosine phosphatase/arsenate reductase